MNKDNFKIVCVDDDKDVLEVTIGILESLGRNCIGFTNVEKAFEYISENKMDIALILSDLRMDNINGFDFKRMLKAQADEIPFVVLTGYWTKEMSAEAMEIGIDAFFEKPISQEVIKEQIEKFAKIRIDLLVEEREMVEGFLDESSPMLDEIEQLILELEERPDSEQTLSTYFRLLHTIKGTASCVGLTQLAAHTHKYEDFIGELRNQNLPVNTKTTNVLLEGLDDLKKYFSDILITGHDKKILIDSAVAKFETTQYRNEIKIGDTFEEEVNEESLKSKTSADRKDDDKMTIPMFLLNEFMEESGELTVIRNSILKTVKQIEARYRGDHEIELLNGLLDGMYNVTSNIQGKITEMRKVPMRQIFRPFKRLVRDLSKQLNKKINLELTGEDLFVDNTVTKLFSNTLIHIIRNSLDHGFETPEIRLKEGKDEVGKLVIDISEVGENIVLQIIDDGKGIDANIIRKKALEKGLYSETILNQMSELEIVNIVFDSGFSTAEHVSDLSGRGVGMDMVRSSFQEMGGSVFVKTKVGAGSTFVLSIPIPKSVLIINTLSVTISSKPFIFHMDEVAEVIRYEKESQNSKMYQIDGELLLKHNDEMIQLRKLSEILKIKTHNEDLQAKNPVHNIVVLRVGEQKFGLVVDEIHEFEEVVSRKINEQIISKDLYHGASLLGNGEVAMILSAIGIAKNIGIEIEMVSNKFIGLEAENQNTEYKIYEYMLFKYDINNYLSVSLDEVERLEKIASAKIESVGDNRVIRYQNKLLPLLEPGYLLGLTENVVDDFIAELNKDFLEIIIVNIHDKQYGILVYELDEIHKTSQEINEDIVVEGLKGTVYINSSTLSVIDLEYLAEKYNGRKIHFEDLHLGEDDYEDDCSAA